MCLDIPRFADRCPHVPPWCERSWYRKVELCGRELTGNFARDCNFHINLGIFFILWHGTHSLLPFRRKACWGFFHPEKSWRFRPGLNPQTWVLKGSTLPLDHRSHLTVAYLFHYNIIIVPHNSHAHWCIFPNLMTSVQKLHHSITLVLAFTTIQQLLCYCGINDLPNRAQFKNNPQGWTHWWAQHIDSKCEHRASGETDLGEPTSEYSLFIHWSNTWKTADFTLISKWKWRFMNECECYSCQLSSTGILNSCQKMTCITTL